MREVLYVPKSQMNDWHKICVAFTKRFGYTLLFVNETSCGVQLNDGSFKHIYIDEMAELLKAEEV